MIAVAALLGRLAYALRVARRVPLGLDSVWYVLESASIADGRGFSDPTGAFRGQSVATAFHPPLYPTFLAGVAKTVGSTLTDYRVAGAVLGVSTVILAALVARRVFAVPSALLAAVFMACYPLLLAVDGSLMSETVAIPLTYAALLVAYRAVDRRGLLWWALLGVLLGVLALARTDAVTLAPFLVAAAALTIRSVSRRQRLTRAAVALGIAALVVAPWVLRNAVRLHDPTIATLSTAGVVAGANCTTAYHGRLIGGWDFNCTQLMITRGLAQVPATRRLEHAGLAYASHHLDRLPVVVLAREARGFGLLHPFTQARTDAAETRNRRWQLFGWFVYLPMLALASIGLVAAFRERMQLGPLLGVLTSVIATIGLSYGSQRFRVLADPIILMLAAFCVVRLTQRLRQRRRPIRRNAHMGE